MKFNFFKKIWGKKERKDADSRRKDYPETLEKEEKAIEVKIEASESFKILPLITEKSLSLARNENKYTFLVEPKINRSMLKKAIEMMFNVNVLKVRTINYQKRVRGLTKIKSVRPKFKKAIVELKDGQKIPIFE
jgi:large subunit ribosomal protein L23